MGFNDEPMIKQKEYTAKKYENKKHKSLGTAKSILIMAELNYISLTNIFVSLSLFLLLLFGTSAIPYIGYFELEFTPENFALRGGYFIYLCIVFIILFAVFAMWYAIGHKKLEIMCIHPDDALPGTAEVNEAAQKDNLANCITKLSRAASASFGSIDEPTYVDADYLNSNDVKTVNSNIFSAVKATLIICQ